MNNDLASLESTLALTLVGQPFLFARLVYADEVTLHFGTPIEYSLPRFGNRVRGSYLLNCRASRCVKSNDAVMEPPATGHDLDVNRQMVESGTLVSAGAKVTQAAPFGTADAFGLRLMFEDGSAVFVLPDRSDEIDPPSESFPEIADWELLTPSGRIRVGPSKTWDYEVSDKRADKESIGSPA